MPDELDLTKLTVTEYLAAAAARLKDLYRPETGDRGFALSPEAAGSPLPTFAVGAGPGPGFFRRDQLPCRSSGS